VDGGGGETDVLLLGHTHEERWDVHHLSADSDVLLSDEHAGVMHGLGELSLLDLGLETALEELGGGKSEDVIELALAVLQESESHHTSDEGLAFKKSSRIVFVKGEQNTGSLSELGEEELSGPYLLLATEPVGTDQTKLVDELFLLEWSSRILGCFRV